MANSNLLTLQQQIDQLRRLIIENRKSKQTNAQVSVEQVTAPTVRGGSVPFQAITILGSDAPSVGNFNFGAVLLNPAGGKIGINATPTAAANTGPLILIGSAISTAAPSICIKSPVTNATTQILIGESETANPAVAQASILVNGSTNGTDPNSLTLRTNSGKLILAPNSSYVDVRSGISYPLVAKTGAYTVSGLDHTITGDATTGVFNITLPTAVGHNRAYIIKKIDSSANAITVNTSLSQTIDGASTYALSAQWKYVMVQSNGANWIIIGGN